MSSSVSSKERLPYVSPILWRCGLVLTLGALGALGALLLAPRLNRRGASRARRAHACVMCREHQRWQRVAVTVIAGLVLTGSGMRAYQQLTAGQTAQCTGDWFLRGAVPRLSGGSDLPPAWRVTRDVVTAPVTGVAYGYAETRGMGLCDVGGITVAFLPSAAGTGGTTVGDVFLTQVKPGLNGRRARMLGEHESRHVSQWTVLTLVGGPLALPVIYTIDEIFFPGPRNHFERDAGLGLGGYHHPAGFGPKPVWGAAAVLALIALLAFRRRLRWLSRVARGGASAARKAEPGRCPVHSPGWFHTRW